VHVYYLQKMYLQLMCRICKHQHIVLVMVLSAFVLTVERSKSHSCVLLHLSVTLLLGNGLCLGAVVALDGSGLLCSVGNIGVLRCCGEER
jgi:hypothetical protein